MFAVAPLRRLPLRLASHQTIRTVRTRPRPGAPKKAAARGTDDEPPRKPYDTPLTDAQRKFLEDKFAHIPELERKAKSIEEGEELQIDPAHAKLFEEYAQNLDGYLDRKIKQPANMHFYELDTHEIGKASPRPQSRLPNDLTMREILEREKSLLEKIARTEEELIRIANNDFSMTPEVMQLFGGDVEQLKQCLPPELLSEADPEKVEREIAALHVQWPKDGSKSDKPEPTVELLNNCLRGAYLATVPALRPIVRQELWKAYKRAKKAVPQIIEAIPNPAWDMLFYVQAARFSERDRKDKHTEELLEDMKKVGIDGPPSKDEEIREMAYREWEEKQAKIEEKVKVVRKERDEDIGAIEEERDFYDKWKPELIKPGLAKVAMKTEKPEVKKKKMSPFQMRLKQRRKARRGRGDTEGAEGND